MAIDTLVLEMRLVRHSESLELDLDPLQGSWTTEQYLKITDQTNHLIEFSDGVIEVLPMPTSRHQGILLLVYERFKRVLDREGGKILVAPVRLQVAPRRFREPDILMLRDASDPRYQDAFWLGADLVVEIVSPDRPERDTEEKPRVYAEAGIPEYWIVNPLIDTITVLVLGDDAYETFGIFGRGDLARSHVFAPLSVAVDDVFDAR